MIPAIESLGMTMGFMPVNQLVEALAIDEGQELTEQTGMPYHGLILLVFAGTRLLFGRYKHAPQGGFFSIGFWTTYQRAVLDKSGCYLILQYVSQILKRKLIRQRLELQNYGKICFPKI